MIALLAEDDIRDTHAIAVSKDGASFAARDRRTVGEPEFLCGDRFDTEFLQDLRGHNRIDHTRIDKKIERLNKALEKLSHAERRVAILSLGLDGGEPLSSKEIVSLIAQQNDGLKVSVNVVDKKRASGQKKLKKLLADLKNSIVFTYRERNSRKDKVTL